MLTVMIMIIEIIIITYVPSYVTYLWILAGHSVQGLEESERHRRGGAL